MPLNRLAAERGMRLERVSAKPSGSNAPAGRAVAPVPRAAAATGTRRGTGAGGRRCGGVRPRPMNLPHSPIAARPAAHPAGSRAEVAHRPEEAHAAAAHSAVGKRAAATQQPSHTTPREGSTARRPAQGAEGTRSQPRAGASRSASREAPRSSASQRGRTRPSEDEEKRRPE